MKGIVFTELIEMVEAKWGLAMVDYMLQPEGLNSKGVYTAVGTYDDQEIGMILGRLSEKSELSIPALQKHFGKYIFSSFADGYKDMLSGMHSTFDLLSRLDDFIHPSVQRLYPDASLPGFEVKERDENRMVLHYRSKRKMPDFADGLILAAGEHFGESFNVDWRALDEEDGLFVFEVNRK